MLIQPIIDKLSTLKLAGMREGLQEQTENPAYKKLSFEERLGLLLDREWSLRQDRKQRRRVRVARFREAAVLEDVDFSSSRGLDRSQVLALSQDDWIRYNRASTILSTQIPVSDWHERLGNGTLSEAVMDRIIHNAYRLELGGESMRKRRSPLTQSGH